MRVDESQPKPEQEVIVNERQYLMMVRDGRLWKLLKEAQKISLWAETAHCELTDDKGMDKDPPARQQFT